MRPRHKPTGREAMSGAGRRLLLNRPTVLSLHQRFSRVLARSGRLSPDPLSAPATTPQTPGGAGRRWGRGWGRGRGRRARPRRPSVWTRLGGSVWNRLGRRLPGFWSFTNKYRWPSGPLKPRPLSARVLRAGRGRRPRWQRGGAVLRGGREPERRRRPTRKELDAQLDDYMSTSRRRLDAQLDDYMSMSRSRLDAQLDDYMSMAGQTSAEWD